MEEAIVVVGAGHSGSKVAAALRKHGWTGPLRLIGDEPHSPYDRPPLSKAVLQGKRTSAQCAFFAPAWYEQNRIELVLEAPVARIDRGRRRVELENGHVFPYGRLVLATGAAVRPLRVPGADLGAVWPLRTPQHADAVAGLLKPGSRLAIIGAGVIGLEVAAAAVELGCAVEVLEVNSSAMGRSVPAAVSDALVAEHSRRGVSIRFDAHVAALEGVGSVSAVRLRSGESLACDAVVFGVGVSPRTELADAADLAVDDGIRTDAFLRTTDERIYACGDVCRYQSSLFGRGLRLENWRNAEAQADTVARNLLGQGKAYDEVPWFWSDQYGLSLQVAGLPALGEITKFFALGSSRIFLSARGDGLLVGAAGLGGVREIAPPIRKLKAAIAAGTRLDLAAAEQLDAILGEAIAAA